MSTTTSKVLKAEKRAKLGTRSSRALRADGRIPGVLEADEKKPRLDIAIDEQAFMASRRHHQHLYEIDVEGGVEAALVRRLEWDVFGDRVLHVEFRRVDRTKKTEVEVELTFVGHPKGVLNHMLTHVVVRALPTEIPDELEVSVADLEVGASVSAGALKMPKGVELVTPADALLARISQLKVDLGPAPVVEAVPTEGAVAAGTTPAAEGAAGAKGAAPAKGDKGAPAKPGDKAAPEKKDDKGSGKKG